jgi:AcrR family transcriptional regulator
MGSAQVRERIQHPCLGTAATDTCVPVALVRPSRSDHDQVVRNDARLNRAKIIDAYRELVVEGGFDAEMEDIAATAGVTRPTVYRHYHDRDTLRREVQAILFEEVAGAVRTVLAKPAPIEIALTSAMRVIVRNLRQWGSVFVGNDNFDAALIRKWSVVARPIAEVIRAGQQRGEIRADLPPELLVNSLIWSSQATLHAAATNSALGAGDLTDMIVSLFLNGARPAPHPARRNS